MSLTKSLLAFLFLLCICILGYWEIAFYEGSLKWDQLDCYFPWRFFVGESIQHRVFPFWNPYQHLGYPIYADMRSVFYPEAFVVGLLGGYNLKVLHFLFVFYITLAGTGLYRLSGLFVKREVVRLTVAAAYILCGYFVGHGQEMFGIVAATWIPWVLFYFIRFQQKLQWSNLWKLAFFLFLQLTGGYQALSLILFYLLLAIFVVGLIQHNRDFGKGYLKSIITKNIALGALVLVSLSVLIVTYVQVSPSVERLTGLSLSDAYTGLMTPQALISLLAPFSVAGDAKFLGTNITMANAYVGIIVLGFYLIGLFLRKRANLWVITIFGLVCLFASLGPHTPLREFLYNYVPGMNLFRMSSFFSYFSQLSFLLVAAVALEKLLNNPLAIKKGTLVAFGTVALALLVLVLSTYIDKPIEAAETLRNLKGLFPGIPTLSYHQRLVFHGYVQLIIVVAFVLVLFRLLRKPRLLQLFVLLFVVSEMFLATRLNFWATVSDPYPAAEIQAGLDAQPTGFPIPSLQIPVSENIEYKPELSPLFHNTNIYSKSISFDGFNSFRLDRFEVFKRDHSATYWRDLDKPFVFATSNQAHLQVLGFDPLKTTCAIRTDSATKIVLQQVFYPGWEVVVDGKHQPMMVYNNIFPSVEVDAGVHEVSFRYKNAPILWAFSISYGLFLLIITACLFFLIRSNGNFSNKKSIGISLIMVGAGILFLGIKWANTQSMDSLRLDWYQELVASLKSQPLENAELVLQLDNLMLMDSLLEAQSIDNRVTYINGAMCHDYDQLVEQFRATEAERIVFARINLAKDQEILELIQQQFPSKVEYDLESGDHFVFRKSGEREALFSTTLDFDSTSEGWTYTMAQKNDSAMAVSGLGWEISKDELGSPTFIGMVAELTSEQRLKCVFQVRGLVPENDLKETRMYVQVIRNNEELWHRAKTLRMCSTEPGKWFTATLVAMPEVKLLPTDVIKVFIWGGGNDHMYLDDMSFTIYPKD